MMCELHFAKCINFVSFSCLGYNFENIPLPFPAPALIRVERTEGGAPYPINLRSSPLHIIRGTITLHHPIDYVSSHRHRKRNSKTRAKSVQMCSTCTYTLFLLFISSIVLCNCVSYLYNYTPHTLIIIITIITFIIM